MARDGAQDALVEASNRWRKVSRLDNPTTWVRRVAINRPMTARIHHADDVGPKLQAEVCIVGTGPAAQATATDLAAAGIDVVMLDAGLFDADRWGRRLTSSVTPSIGAHYPNPADQFSIRLGGTSHRWGIVLDPKSAGSTATGLRLGRLSDTDFNPPEGTSRRAWPISADALGPHYERAETRFGIHPTTGASLDATNDDRVAIETMWAADAEPYLTPCRLDVRVVIGCVARRVEVGRGGRVERLVAVSRSGRPIQVSADCFVLAMGTVQTTRLLLDSPGHHGPTVANSSGLVGRNLVDHPQLVLGQLVVDREADLTALAELAPQVAPGGTGESPVIRWPNLVTSASRSRQPDVVRLAVTLLPDRRDRRILWPATNKIPRPLGARTGAVNAAGNLADSIRQRRADWRALTALPKMLTGLDELAIPIVRRQVKATWSVENPHWPGNDDPPATAFQLFAVAEQLPNLDNRIRLTDERDALGGRRVRIDWRWSDADIDRAERSAEEIRQMVAGLGCGRILVRRGRAALHKINSHHAAGTTPMSAQPEDGVVDPNLRTHDHPNLFIVGSSVLNSHGYSNPTLTDIALGYRLGQHLVHGSRASATKAPRS